VIFISLNLTGSKRTEECCRGWSDHTDQRGYLRRDEESSRRKYKPHNWSVSQRIALACKILAKQGHADSQTGQLTVREGANSFWTQRYGLGFDEAKASNLIQVDSDLNPLDTDAVPNPAVRFHIYIYQRRPDLNCIVRTHPPYTSALAMLKEPLVAAHMDAMPLYDDCAYLAEWPGVPFGDEEGRIISTALGEKRSVLLANHGLLTVGASIEEATTLAIVFERAARLQLLARPIGPIHEVSKEAGEEEHAYTKKPIYSMSIFDYHARRILSCDGSCLS
jgi:L-fuculose-phosphate aldolase